VSAEDDIEAVESIIASRAVPRSGKAKAIVEYFAGPVHEVWPRNTHAVIETVEVYGLRIGVDANGYAAEVYFPDGAEF
jgi:hypothetical protein